MAYKVTEGEYETLRARTSKARSDTPPSSPPKKSKYGNAPKTVDGIWFASAAEAERYQVLKILVRNGTIHHLERQKTFRLEVNGIHVCDYRADFTYWAGDREIVEDVKGYKTDVYKIKKLLMRACYGVLINEVNVKWRRKK